MQNHTIYKSTDADAPQVTKSAGAFKTILKACLITGYGDGATRKEPAGWDMVFEKGEKMAIRPTDAHGENLILRVDDTPDTYYCKLAAYKNMTDIDNGEKVFDGGKWTKSNGKWILVATSRWFWFLISTNDGYWSPLFFGNVTNPLPEEKNNTLLLHRTWQDYDVENTSKHYGFFNKRDDRNYFLLSSKGQVNLNTGFDAEKYNLSNEESSTREIVWLDIVASTGSDIHGIVPALKTTPVAFNRPTWDTVSDNVYFIRLSGYVAGSISDSKQLIMDLSYAS